MSERLSTVAVTGASGVLGRQLVPALLQAGATVRVLSRTRQTSSGAGVDSVHGDIVNEASLVPFLAGADAVVHLAGVAHTALKTAAEEDAAAAVNVGGTRSLLQAARLAGVRQFVFISSAHVYAGQQGIDLREDSGKDAGTGYASMKLRAEDLLRQEADVAQTVTILRPCLTYGPGVRFNLQQLMAAVRAGRYVHPGGADAQRSFVSVDTVAAAAVHVLQGRLGGTYNIADREPESLRRWVNALAAELRVRPPRTVPVGVLRLLARAGDVARRAGLPAPLTTAALHKLTAPFTLNLDRLAETGFTWPATTGDVIRDMVFDFETNHPAGAKA